MGSKTSTTTQNSNNTTQALPEFAKAYSSLANQTQGTYGNLANNPNAQTQVAGLTAPTNQGINYAQQNFNAFQPYLQQAGQAVGQGIQPITTQSVMNNPLYQQQVAAINQTGQQALGQAQQQVQSQAAQLGALTGDRAQIATGNALAPIEAQTQAQLANAASTAFGQSLQGSEASAANALQGAGIYGNLGNSAEANTGAGANLLYGAGNTLQQQQQNVLNAGQQNAFLPAQEQAALNAQIAGLGGAAGSTSTGTGTTTQPVNLLGQIAGLGIAGVGALGNKSVQSGLGYLGSFFSGGGRVGYDGGGVVTNPPNLTGARFMQNPHLPIGPIPAVHGGLNHQGPMPSLAQQSGNGQSGGGLSDMLDAFKRAQGAMGPSQSSPTSGWGATTTDASGQTLARGGMVRRGYDDGGLVGQTDAIALANAGAGNVPDPSQGYATGMLGAGQGFGQWLSGNAPSATYTTDTTPVGSSYAAAPSQPAAVQTVSAAPGSGIGAAYSAPTPQTTGYMGAGASGLAGAQQMAMEKQFPSQQPWYRDPLIQLGLGMAASSPTTGIKGWGGGLASVANAVGHGGADVAQWQDQQRRVELEAQRLQEEARMHSSEIALQQAELPLKQAQTQAAQVSNTQRAQMDKIMQSPEFQSNFSSMDPQMKSLVQAAAASGDINGVLGLIEKSQPTVGPDGTIYDRRSGTVSNMYTGQTYKIGQNGITPVTPTNPTPSASPANPATAQDKTAASARPTGVNWDYVDALPDPAFRGQVQAVLKGEQLIPQGPAGQRGIWPQITRAAYTADPDFSVNDATLRFKRNQELTNGDLGKLRGNVGTMAGHFNEALDAVSKLDTGSYPAWNAVINGFEEQTGSPKQKAAAVALNAYSTELAKVLNGGTATVDQVKEVRSQFGQNASQNGLRAALQVAENQARDRILANDSATQQVMTKWYNPEKQSVMTPYAKSQLDKARSDPWLHPENVKPVPVKGPDEARKLPKGTAFVTPDGRVFPNQ